MRWTVRAAVLCYLARVAILLRTPRQQRAIPSRGECLLWLFGCFSYLAHVVLAFHFTHGWSHNAALQHTAIETEKLIGARRGEGIWVNYLFTMIWIADAARIGIARIRERATTRWIDRSVQAFFAFMVINATVVFGPPAYRILAVPVVLAQLWFYRAGRFRTADGSA